MKYLRTVLFIGILSSQFQNANPSAATNEEFDGEPVNTIYAKDYLWEKNYEETINFIKKHEGFRALPYHCAAGVLTVGYGHAIKKGERFNHSISEFQADSLLRADYKIALKAVTRNTNLDGSKKLAIAHFIFAVGIGNFNRSSLKKSIIQGKPIDNIILKWSYYNTPGGKRIKSKVAYKLREWELNMYHKDDKFMLISGK